jgi:hypothetical protein
MNLPVYYVVRAYVDTTHRGASHRVEAGPFFEHWRAREWVDAAGPKTRDQFTIQQTLIALTPVGAAE